VKQQKQNISLWRGLFIFRLVTRERDERRGQVIRGVNRRGLLRGNAYSLTSPGPSWKWEVGTMVRVSGSLRGRLPSAVGLSRGHFLGT